VVLNATGLVVENYGLGYEKSQIRDQIKNFCSIKRKT